MGDVPLAYVSRGGDALLVAGAHTGWAWCWCQPTVMMVPTTCPHGQHPQVSHRRVMDMSESAYDDLGRASWTVNSGDGSVYPDGQEPTS